MMTVFSIPKPFEGHIGTIQRNAVESWRRLPGDPQVILFGDEPGTAEVADEVGVEHVEQIPTNDEGTPLLAPAFEQAEDRARHPHLCYVNGDIILLPQHVDAARQVFDQRPESLVVGHRWDLDVTEPIPFEEGWASRLEARAKREGTRHGRSGIDYFVFEPGSLGSLPPFAVGRPGWDNWLLYHARERGLALTDVTPSNTVIHQNPDYGHHPDGFEGVWEGEEAECHMEIIGGAENAFTLLDARYVLEDGQLNRRVHPYHLYRATYQACSSVPILRKAVEAARDSYSKVRSVWRRASR